MFPGQQRKNWSGGGSLHALQQYISQVELWDTRTAVACFQWESIRQRQVRWKRSETSKNQPRWSRRWGKMREKIKQHFSSQDWIPHATTEMWWRDECWRTTRSVQAQTILSRKKQDHRTQIIGAYFNFIGFYSSSPENKENILLEKPAGGNCGNNRSAWPLLVCERHWFSGEELTLYQPSKDICEICYPRNPSEAGVKFQGAASSATRFLQ